MGLIIFGSDTGIAARLAGSCAKVIGIGEWITLGGTMIAGQSPAPALNTAAGLPVLGRLTADSRLGPPQRRQRDPRRLGLPLQDVESHRSGGEAVAKETGRFGDGRAVLSLVRGHGEQRFGRVRRAALVPDDRWIVAGDGYREAERIGPLCQIRLGAREDVRRLSSGSGAMSKPLRTALLMPMLPPPRFSGSPPVALFRCRSPRPAS